MPRLDTFEGVLNLLSLCNVVILSNVLDARTYRAPNQRPEHDATPKELRRMMEYDLNAFSRQEREAACFARGICLQLLFWFNATYRVWDRRTDEELADPGAYLLAKQAEAIIVAKRRNEEVGIPGVPHCTADLLKRQLINVLQHYPPAFALFNPETAFLEQGDSMTYDDDLSYYKVERRTEEKEYTSTFKMVVKWA